MRWGQGLGKPTALPELIQLTHTVSRSPWRRALGALRRSRLRRLELDVVLLGAVAAKAPWQACWALVAGGRARSLRSSVAQNLMMAQGRWRQALKLLGQALGPTRRPCKVIR